MNILKKLLKKANKNGDLFMNDDLSFKDYEKAFGIKSGIFLPIQPLAMSQGSYNSNSSNAGISMPAYMEEAEHSDAYAKIKAELKKEIVTEVFEEIFQQLLDVNIIDQKEMKARLGTIMERMGYHTEEKKPKADEGVDYP
jgi:hypothetical protein